MKFVIALLSGFLLLAPQAAHALASCIVSATPVNFGVYDPMSATSKDNDGEVTVSCSLLLGVSLLVAYTIDLSSSQSGTGSILPRTMKSGSNVLNYNLFTPTSAYGTVWGNNAGGTGRVIDGYLLGLGGATTKYVVKGRIPQGQNVKGGSYSDNIIVTITY